MLAKALYETNSLKVETLVYYQNEQDILRHKDY
jgi:hypothetical protein